MAWSSLLLEYFNLLISPSGVAAILGTTTLVLFRGDISNLLGRISKIQFPGGGGVTA